MRSLFLQQKNQKGYALFIAVITAGVLLLIAVAMSDLSYKEQIITTSAKESKAAFYAADTGLECALYWDAIGVGNESAFVGNGTRNITCAGETKTVNRVTPDANGESVTPISFGNNGSPYCFIINIYKELQPDQSIETRIRAQGYNNCNPSDRRRLERALEANY